LPLDAKYIVDANIGISFLNNESFWIEKFVHSYSYVQKNGKLLILPSNAREFDSVLPVDYFEVINDVSARNLDYAFTDVVSKFKLTGNWINKLEVNSSFNCLSLTIFLG
jgi:hypothetical protein